MKSLAPISELNQIKPTAGGYEAQIEAKNASLFFKKQNTSNFELKDKNNQNSPLRH